ncbi:MAG: DUF1249 domain-containing protein [Gammaproteobacteria bacterium]
MLIFDQQPAIRAHDLNGTFAGLMDLYERNYIQLRLLIPRLPAAGESLVSRAPGSLDVHLTVVERFRYTAELNLTYFFRKEDEPKAEPDVRIRIYHDARLAEVMAAHLRHWPVFANEEQVGLATRWRVNRFLFKWLSYCLHQGHRFGTRDRRAGR